MVESWLGWLVMVESCWLVGDGRELLVGWLGVFYFPIGMLQIEGA